MCQSLHRRLSALLIAALLLGLSLALPPTTVRASLVRWVVPTTDGPVVQTGCTSILNFCSLREALAAAADGDTIQFHPQTTGTILLDPTQGALQVNHSVTIAGPGAGTLAVDGGKAVSVFTVASGVTATISGLTIQHGVGRRGGGINNLGTLSVMNSIITANVAQSGGGIASTGTLTVTNSTLSGNSAPGGFGGGIENAYGTLTVTDSTLSGNSAANGGGIRSDGATLAVTDSSLSGNSASSGNGGGIAIAPDSAATVTNSTLSGNSAANAGGGGIFNAGTVTVMNSTLSHNATGSGGGIRNDGTLTVTDSTFSGNSAVNGGGILNTGMATLSNTLVANNPGGGDLFGAFTGSHDLIDDAANAASFTDGVDGNIIGHSALLGTLGSFGGTTPTVPLLPGSPAIDAGSCPAGYHDQRGIATVGAACDIGGFESQGFLLTAAAGTSQSTAVASAFAQPLVVMVTSAHGEPVQGGQVTFTAPTSGPGAAVASSSRTVGAGATASVTATANGTAGAYSVIASAAGASSAAFALANTPILTSVSPASGGTAGGNHVTLTGLGFGTSAATVAVSIGGVAAPVTSVTNTQLVVTVPTHVAGAVDVAVTVNGKGTTAVNGYTYGTVSALPATRPAGTTGRTPPSPLPAPRP